MTLRLSPIVLGVALLAAGAGFGWMAAGWRGHASPTADTTAAPAPAASAERKVLYWYDPMVPTQKFDKPGKSPFMDMQLVPRYADETDTAEAADAPALKLSTAAQQSLGLRLAMVEKRQIGSSTEAVGTVQLSERDVAIVQARANGYVERVHARAPGDVIAAGAPLAEVLNPEWLGAQQEYLALRATGDAALARAARQRLVLLGMPAALVEQVERSGQAVALQTIVAPTGGVITELMVRAGMTLAPGMTLARINGLGTVWLEAAVPEALATAVRPGQAVAVRFPALPGEVTQGRVAAVLPEANKETRTLRVRIELPNKGHRLQAGLFAQVSLSAPKREALVVPAEAVIRTGRRALVYVAEPGGRYRPVEVQIGEQVDETLVVLGGLSEGQQVVASGQFLVDSEASLQGVLARAASPAAPASAPMAGPTSYSTRGTVVEFDTGSITLEHEPVPALKWPSMTMPFKLADAALVKGLKTGQVVQFSFVKQGDDWVMTQVSTQVQAAAPAAPVAPAMGASR